MSLAITESLPLYWYPQIGFFFLSVSNYIRCLWIIYSGFLYDISDNDMRGTLQISRQESKP